MKTRVTITIDPKLHTRAKRLARERKTSVSGLFEFTAEDVALQYFGAREPQASSYEVVRAEGSALTVQFDGNEMIDIEVAKDRLTFKLPGTEDDLVWEKRII